MQKLFLGVKTQIFKRKASYYSLIRLVAMGIDPEVIPSYSSAGFNAVRVIPKWAIYSLVGVGVLLLVGILKTIFPLILISLLVGFIWKQAIK